MSERVVEETTEEAIADLERSHRRYERAIEAVAEIGEDELRRLADAYEELTATLDAYEDRAIGSGDFEAFVEFQGKVGEFTETLPEDLRHRGAFERADETLQQRRLSASDFETARQSLEPVAEDVTLLTDRDEARERYRNARNRVQQRLSTVEAAIADRERLRELGAADLDAPTERLRDPIEAYDEAVREAFESFKRGESARSVLEFVTTAARYPLVPFRDPPSELLEYVRERPTGEEPIAQLLEYADYSHSKLDHYVEEPTALRSHVATRQTYLRRLDAEPLTVGWPPPEAAVLRYRCRELESVVRRIADEDALRRLRTVRLLPREVDFQRLRTSAVAREELDDAEIRDLRDGTVESELASLRAERQRLADALQAHPEP
ncbi:MAG: hypothetical protein ABEI96_04595 [Haloarculaceae archaeon]